MSSAAFQLQTAMRERLLAHTPLLTLLGGAHIFDEIPRGAQEPFVSFASIETRDWSVIGQLAHEHFVTLDVKTRARGRKLAETIAGEIASALQDVELNLEDCKLVNLQLLFWSVSRSQEHFGASLRFRCATEPN